MTVQDVLNNAGLSDYSALSIIFIMETKNKEPNFDKVYLYIHKEQNELPWLSIIENNEVTHLYEIYSNDQKVTDEILEQFELTRKPDSSYYLKKNLSSGEYEEVWQSKDVSTYICKDRELNETEVSAHNIFEEDYKEICERFEVINLLTFGREYFLVLSADMESYQSYKDKLNIDFTF